MASRMKAYSSRVGYVVISTGLSTLLIHTALPYYLLTSFQLPGKIYLSYEKTQCLMFVLFPLFTYITTEFGGNRFMLAHAKTFEDPNSLSEHMLTMSELDYSYLKTGLQNRISVIGHTTVDYIRFFMAQEREKKNTIWVNKKKNVFCIDCACGFDDQASRLGALRLNDFAMFYA